MNSVSYPQRYLPHELSTRYYAVRLYRQYHDVHFVCRRYKVSKSSLMRWNKAFDGTIDSLVSTSHRPLSPHPAAHTEQELKWITITTGVTLTFPSVNFTESCVQKKGIPGIPDRSTASLYVSDTERKLKVQKRHHTFQNHMTPQRNLALNGRWM